MSQVKVTIPPLPTATTTQLDLLSKDVLKVVEEFAPLLALRCDNPQAQIGIDKLKDELRAYCEGLDKSLEFISENQILMNNTHILFGNLARPERWTREDLQLEVDSVRCDVKELRQKLAEHKAQMRKSRQHVITTRLELQDALDRVKDEKKEHLDQRKQANLFVAFYIWLKQTLGMGIGGLSRWDGAIGPLEVATNLMLRLEQQASLIVGCWVKMDETFKIAENSIKVLNISQYSKGRMQGLEDELGRMKDDLFKYQSALVHIQDYYPILFKELS